MKDFIIEVETSYGRKEHYPLSKKDIVKFINNLVKEFDWRHIIIKSKNFNTIYSYNDEDLNKVLTKIGDLEKAENIIVNGRECVVYFFIKLNNLEEIRIYLMRKNIFKS